MNQLKTGIIGCGKVAQLHAKALAASEHSDFKAVFSRDQGKADAFAADFAVRGYNDVAGMVETAGLEAVIVCTPHPFHAEPALQAMQAGAHVLVEKPLASSLADCERMIAGARDAGVRLGTVSQRRFYAPCQRIRSAIDSGKIGTPVLGTVTMLGWRDQAYYESDAWRGTWRDEGGGVMVNQAPHQLDLLQWFMGPIEEVFGCWGNLNHPYIEVEDTAIAAIRFASGALGNIVVSNSQNPALFGKVLVTGSNGGAVGVQTDGGAMFIAGMSNIEEPPVNDIWTVAGEEDRLAEWRQEDEAFFASVNAVEHFMRVQVDDFLQAILEDRDPLVTGEEGRKTVELFTAVYRSQRDGAPVRFPLAPETDGGMDGRGDGSVGL